MPRTIYTSRSLLRGDSEWKALVEARLAIMCKTHACTGKVCAGIDVRRSAPFVRRDLIHAHELLDVLDDDGHLSGFAFLKTNYTPLYVALIVSLRPKMGYFMMHELQTTTRFRHTRMVVRSTDKALGFYLKLNFRLFDWSALETGYIGDGEESLTSQLRRGGPHVETTRTELKQRNWMNDDEVEWPLVISRVHSSSSGATRESSRLRSRHDACLLRPPDTAGDHTS